MVWKNCLIKLKEVKKWDEPLFFWDTEVVVHRKGKITIYTWSHTLFLQATKKKFASPSIERKDHTPNHSFFKFILFLLFEKSWGRRTLSQDSIPFLYSLSLSLNKAAIFITMRLISHWFLRLLRHIKLLFTLGRIMKQRI